MTTCSSLPISPAWIRPRSALKEGSKRRLKPTMMVGLRSLIRAQEASTLARSRSIGFSHSTALPASTARTSRSRWVSVDEAISTASTSFGAEDLVDLAGPPRAGGIGHGRCGVAAMS